MALSTCEECGSPVSTNATACPRCGAPPPGRSTAPLATPAEPRTRRSGFPWISLLLVLALGLGGGGYWLWSRTASSPVVRALGTNLPLPVPQQLVSETISLDEGHSRGYSIDLATPTRITVALVAQPAPVNVMLMDEGQWQRFVHAGDTLLGGQHADYRPILSRQSVLRIQESEVVPAGRWRIVVERPRVAILFQTSTSAAITITRY